MYGIKSDNSQSSITLTPKNEGRTENRYQYIIIDWIIKLVAYKSKERNSLFSHSKRQDFGLFKGACTAFELFWPRKNIF